MRVVGEDSGEETLSGWRTTTLTVPPVRWAPRTWPASWTAIITSQASGTAEPMRTNWSDRRMGLFQKVQRIQITDLLHFQAPDLTIATLDSFLSD